MKPKGGLKDIPKAIDTIKQIVADKQNMQVKFDDGKMKVDLYTASAVSQVYDAVKSGTQGKIDDMLRTKDGMLRMANFAFSKLSEGVKAGKRIDEVLPKVASVALGALASKGPKGAAARGAVQGALSSKGGVKGAVQGAISGGVKGATASAASPGMIKDKSGKMHKADSPRGKMIANMTKKTGTAAVGGGTTPQQIAQAKRDVMKNKVKAGVKKVKSFATNQIAKSLDRTGMGNPLAASKYSPEDKAVDIMKGAMKKVEEEEIEELSMPVPSIPTGPLPKIVVTRTRDSHHPPAKKSPAVGKPQRGHHDRSLSPLKLRAKVAF